MAVASTGRITDQAGATRERCATGGQDLHHRGVRPGRFTHLYNLTRKGIGELDFLIETDDGDVLASEIKPGARLPSHASLDRVMADSGYGLDRAYVFAKTNVFEESGVTYLPMYML